MADLLQIVPTRSRPRNARRVLDAWDATDAWKDAALVFAADADDPQISGYRQLADERRGDGKHWWVTELPRWLPMVHKLDATAREHADRFWALGFAGDDHLPRTINWAPTYLDALRELGSGIVYGDDLYQGANCPTQWAMTADIVRALGRMVPAPVEHMESDVSILALGKEASCIRYLPQVVIEHMHPHAGKSATDAQYEHVNRREQYHRDGAIYRKWRQGQLAQDAAKVRALRAVEPVR